MEGRERKDEERSGRSSSSKRKKQEKGKGKKKREESSETRLESELFNIKDCVQEEGESASVVEQSQYWK